jgi:hypothetical protein
MIKSSHVYSHVDVLINCNILINDERVYYKIHDQLDIIIDE